MDEAGKKFSRFAETVSRLRGPDGCPWDRKQTPQTLKKYLVEETYELAEAIDSNDYPHIREELGDLLFQVMLLSLLYNEKKLFSLEDVIDEINAKMVRRHPHVFGDEGSMTEDEQRRRWQEIKAEEGRRNEPGSSLDSLPRSLPALRRAQRIAERVARVGFSWDSTDDALAKIAEEFAELQKAAISGSKNEAKSEAGDLLFSVVCWCMMSGINAEEALDGTIARFISRFTMLEEKLAETGKTTASADKKDLLNLWNDTKID